MKKSISLILIIIMLFSFAVYAEGPAPEPEIIQITFKIGESILNINGRIFEVETPFVVDGVTLVPVRIITEAFGAAVGWDGKTQKITIDYNDTNIILTLEDKYAYINGKKIKLLAAPQLVNSTSMVPLRFISESFGAKVSFYDKPDRVVVEYIVPIPPKEPDIKVSEEDDEGYRTYTNKNMGISFKILGDFENICDKTNDGEIIFLKKDKQNSLSGMIYLSIFKIEEGTTAGDIAAKDRNCYTLINKSDLYSCTSLAPSKELSELNGVDAVTYTCKYNTSDITSLFWIKGKYGYALKWFNNNKSGKAETQTPAIKNIVTAELNYDQIGDLKLWQEPSETVTEKNAEFYYWLYSITVVSNWERSDDPKSFFNIYAADITKSKYYEESKNGYITYTKNRRGNSWKFTNDFLTYIYNKNIAINISAMDRLKHNGFPEKLPQREIKSSIIKSRLVSDDTSLLETFAKVALSDKQRTKEIKTTLQEYLKFPKINFIDYDAVDIKDTLYSSNSPYSQITKMGHFDYIYTNNINKKYYVTMYEFYGRKNKGYILTVSIAEEIYTPKTLELIDRILQSIQMAPKNV